MAGGNELRRRLGGAFLGLLLAAPAGAQSVTLDAKQATLGEILPRLSLRTGYEFRSGNDNPGGASRHDFAWKDAPLTSVLADLSSAYQCDFYSADPSGFFVVPPQKAPEREVSVGPYRLRLDRPQLTPDRGVLQWTLAFQGPDDTRTESIAGLGGDLQVLDNFGRSLLPPAPVALRSSQAPRSRLTEYWHRLPLALPDGRATRIRSLRGSLVLYRKVTPLRFEFPLDPKLAVPGSAPSGGQESSQQGVRIRLDKVSLRPALLGLQARLNWPAGVDVIGRGTSRAPMPYLVDEQGRVRRYEVGGSSSGRGESGEPGIRQSMIFTDLRFRPVKLVYELFRREDPSVALPFQVKDVPLPPAPDTSANRDLPPFHHPSGGSLALQVTDRNGRPLEGQLSLGLSRREAGGWSGWRWMETVTDPKGGLRLERLQAGQYRLKLRFRLDPAAPPLAVPGAPAEVRIPGGAEFRLPPLRMPLLAPPDP